MADVFVSLLFCSLMTGPIQNPVVACGRNVRVGNIKILSCNVVGVDCKALDVQGDLTRKVRAWESRHEEPRPTGTATKELTLPTPLFEGDGYDPLQKSDF